MMQLEEAVLAHPGAVLVAHSLGCVLVAAWAAHSQHTHHVKAALLVAPADVERLEMQHMLHSWSPIVRERLPFPSVMATSRNDPFCSFMRASALAHAWGSRMVDCGMNTARTSRFKKDAKNALSRGTSSASTVVLHTRTLHTSPPAALLVAASTGGPTALPAFLAPIANRIDAPILIVQHMPAAFTPVFAEKLESAIGKHCREAREGDTLAPGTMLLAPGDKHMRVARVPAGRMIHLDQGEPVNYCRPAADPLFETAAAAFGSRLLCVVLTGMGHDGRAGAGKIVEAGGRVIVQDESSSVVWGMPGAVAQAFGVFPYLLMTVVMIMAAGSTLDSTFASVAKSIGQELPMLAGRKPGPRAMVVGMWTMIVFALLGNIPMIAGTDILKATTISGTMVIGLAPIFLFSGRVGHSPLSFHLAFWPGIALGVLQAMNLIPAGWAMIHE